MQLAIAISKRRSHQGFASPKSAVAEVTLNGFDTARVFTNMYVDKQRLFVGMECKYLESKE